MDTIKRPKFFILLTLICILGIGAWYFYKINKKNVVPEKADLVFLIEDGRKY